MEIDKELQISQASATALPAARVPVSIRLATLEDIPFIDALQKANSKMVGWMATKQLEGKIGAGHVLVADEDRTEYTGLRPESGGALPTQSSLGTRRSGDPSTQSLGYCIGTDRYFKHDDIGIIYQMNVVPGHRRKLVGAMLIKALFDRAAYGCKLYCCWCAQDIEANYFWESLGFVPLAFRSGGVKKSGRRPQVRTHIFWQRRIREGDATTPYWFPSQTNAGAIREDRLVLPIPPGTHWSDAKPMILPREHAKVLAAPHATRQRAKRPQPITTIAAGGLRLGPLVAALRLGSGQAKPETSAKQPRAKVKNDPAHVAAARELRDRYLEQFNSGNVLPGGKYEVARRINRTRTTQPVEPGFTRRALPEAA